MKPNNVHNSNHINPSIKRASSEITLKKRESINTSDEISFFPENNSSSDIILNLMQREKDILILEKTLSILKEQNRSHIKKIDDLEFRLNESQIALKSMIENYNNIYNEFIYETKHNMQLIEENKKLKQNLIDKSQK